MKIRRINPIFIIPTGLLISAGMVGYCLYEPWYDATFMVVLGFICLTFLIYLYNYRFTIKVYYDKNLKETVYEIEDVD